MPNWSAKFENDGKKKFTYVVEMEIGDREIGKRRRIASYFAPLGSAPGREIAPEDEKKAGFTAQLETSLEMRRVKLSKDPATIRHVHRIYADGPEGIRAFVRDILKIEEIRGASGQIRDGRYVFVL